MKIKTNRNKVLDTLEYFLEKYLQAAEDHKDSSGLEVVVMEQFLEQLRWVRADHKRLKELNMPKVVGGTENENKES
jgi:Mn-dependent DtxR family transcriptional regulator